MAVIFGTNIEIPQFEDAILTEIVKKRGEREILHSFIDGFSLSGESRLSEVIRDSNNSIKLDEEPSDELELKAVEFIMQKMKQAKTSVGLSVYEETKLKLVEQIEKGKIGSYARSARLSGLKKGLIFGLPEKLKEAEAILVGKLKSDVKKNGVFLYLVQVEIRRRITLLAKDLFFAINYGLNKSETLRFVSILYELRKRQSAVPTNEERIKRILAKTIQTGEEIILIHLKCPRYKYPEGKRLEIIDHCSDEIVQTKDSSLLRPGEDGLLYNLSEIVKIFSYYSVPVSLRILIMDQDIDDHLPAATFFTQNTDTEKIRIAMEKYRNVIINTFEGEGVIVEFIRSYLDQLGLLSEFNQLRTETVRELFQEKGNIPQKFAEAEVNDYFEKNIIRMAIDYGRSFARDIAYSKLATMQALGVLKKIPEGETFILIEEDRKNENNFIGGVRGSALPVFFANLRK